MQIWKPSSPECSVSHLKSCNVVELSLDASKLEKFNVSEIKAIKRLKPFNHITHLHFRGIDSIDLTNNVTNAIDEIEECGERINTLKFEGTSALWFLGPSNSYELYGHWNKNQRIIFNKNQKVDAVIKFVKKCTNLMHIE